MKRLLYLISALIVSILAIEPSFCQQQDEEILPLYDPTPRTAYARHIQLPDKYTSVILDCVNNYVGDVCADKSEEWWHQQGPILIFYIKSEGVPNKFGLIMLPRNDIYKYPFYTYVGKYLVFSDSSDFEKFVDNGELYEVNYIICFHTNEPICWYFEEKDDSLQLIEQQTSHCPACRWIK